MSSHYSLNISIQNFQHENFQLSQIICEVHQDSLREPIAQLEELNNFTTIISNLSSNDIVQFIFKDYENHSLKEKIIGSISFDFSNLLKSTDKKVSQWVTLFDDLEDDLFDGEFGVDDVESPRFYIHVEMLQNTLSNDNNAIYIASSNNQSNHLNHSDSSFSQPIHQEKEYEEIKTQVYDSSEENLQNNKVKFRDDLKVKTQNVEALLKFRHSMQDIHNIPTKLNKNLIKSLCFAKDANGDSINILNSIQQLYTIENVLYTNHIDSEESFASLMSSTSEGDDPVKTLKKNFAKEIDLLNNKLQQANDLAQDAKKLRKLVLNSDHIEINETKEFEEDKGLYYQEEVTNLRQINQELKEKIQILTNKLDNIQRENSMIKKKEISFAEKINQMKTELEKYETVEQFVNALQQQLSEAKEQIQVEIEKRLELLRDKDQLSSNFQIVREEHYHLKEKYENVIREVKSLEKRTKRHEVEEENNLKKELQQTKTENNNFKEIIRELQDEIFELKNTKKMEKDLSNGEHESARSDSGVEKAFIESLNNQITNLKNQIIHLENEKQNLKDELFKGSDNYTKLTNKYIELTEALTTLSQNSTSRSLRKSRSPHLKNISKEEIPTNSSTTNFEPENAADEIESKVNEYISAYKIPPLSFLRLDRNSYSLRGKKIHLKLAYGKLLVKQGSIFQPFEDFWKSSKEVQEVSTPPFTSKLQGNKSTSSINEGDLKSNPSTEKKVKEPLRPIRTENDMNMEEHGNSIEWNLNKKSLKETEKEDIRHSILESKKIIGEIRLPRHENLKQKDNGNGKPLEKKPLSHAYKFNNKTKGHRESSPVLKNQNKHL